MKEIVFSDEREAKETYGSEFRWSGNIFIGTNSIVDLSNTFFLFLFVQFRIDSIDKCCHFINLNEIFLFSFSQKKKTPQSLPFHVDHFSVVNPMFSSELLRVIIYISSNVVKV